MNNPAKPATNVVSPQQRIELSSEAGTPKSRGSRRPFAVILLVMAVLLSTHACSWQKEPARLKSEQEMQERITAWKMPIGNRYQIKQAIDLHAAPFSRDTREVGKGRRFTIKDLVLDEADPYTAAYALRLDSGGGAYIGVRDLQRLIQSGSVASMDKVPEAQKKGSAFGKQAAATVQEQPRAATTRAIDPGNAYYSVRYRASCQVSDLLRGNFDGEDLPMLIVMAGAIFGLVWALWHTMGFPKILSFLGILALVCWELTADLGWGSWLVNVAVLILLVTLVGFWSAARFTIVLASLAVMAYVVHAAYHQITNVAVVVLLSVAVAALVGLPSCFLLKKTYGIERELHQE